MGLYLLTLYKSYFDRKKNYQNSLVWRMTKQIGVRVCGFTNIVKKLQFWAIFVLHTKFPKRLIVRTNNRTAQVRPVFQLAVHYINWISFTKSYSEKCYKVRDAAKFYTPLYLNSSGSYCKEERFSQFRFSFQFGWAIHDTCQLPKHNMHDIVNFCVLSNIRRLPQLLQILLDASIIYNASKIFVTMHLFYPPSNN